MNPQIVWNVWRRIMRESVLQNALFNTAEADRNWNAFSFSNEEKMIAQDYAKNAERAKWPVVNYRYRLSNSFLNALESGGASMVLRSLLAKKIDIRDLGEEFLELKGWKDYGPYVYTYCFEALNFLLTHEATKEPNGLRELISLEKTVAELMIGLSKNQEKPTGNPLLLRREPSAMHYQSQVQLSQWLRDKSQLGITDTEKGIENFLVYLPNLDSTHRFTMLTPRAVELYQILENPCLYSELPALLENNGYAGSTDDDNDCLKALASYQAITIPGEL